MKKIFPFLLMALTGLVVGHFVQMQAPDLATKIEIKKDTPLKNSIQKNELIQTSGTSVFTEKKTNETIVEIPLVPLEQTTTRAMGLHEKTASFYSHIPRKSSLTKIMVSEMHETPHPVLEAGKHLGNMHEYFSKHDHDPNAELNFYLKCSQQKDFFDSARALCAARASQLFLKITGNRISPKIFDDRIAALKDQITL